MKRAQAVVQAPASLPEVPAYQDTLWRRTRSFVAATFFESLAQMGRLHPAANPSRHGVEVERDVLYGNHDAFHRLDIYRPITRPKPWPVVFYVHGGAFHLLSKDTHWLMGLVFARFGYLVVNISYRLAPKHPYPAAIEDTCDAYRWLAQRITQLGGDPNRVVVAGESAGGNLITALTIAACQRRTEPWARAVYDLGLVPRAALPFCAMLEVSRPERFAQRRRLPFWVDGMIRDASASYLHAGGGDLADPLRIVEEAAQHRASFDQHSASLRDAARSGGAGPFDQHSASLRDAARSGGAGPFDRALPPFFAPVGTRDPLLDDTRRLESALARLEVPCEARYYPGGIHAFHALIWDPAARRCWRDALAFLDRHAR